jgi:hypothetical protein
MTPNSQCFLIFSEEFDETRSNTIVPTSVPRAYRMAVSHVVSIMLKGIKLAFLGLLRIGQVPKTSDQSFRLINEDEMPAVMLYTRIVAPIRVPPGQTCAVARAKIATTFGTTT